MKHTTEKKKEEVISNFNPINILNNKIKYIARQVPDSKKHVQQTYKHSPRRLDDVVYSLKNTPSESIPQEEESQPNQGIKDLTEKYLQGNHPRLASVTKKCSLKQVENKLLHIQQADRMAKIQRLFKQQLKRKQLVKYWDVQRKASKAIKLQEKIRTKLDLKEREKQVINQLSQWKAQMKLQEQAKQQQKKFTHIINMEKIDMLRRSKHKYKITENRYIKQKEKESWRDMKFKEHNTLRLKTFRKHTELDPLGLHVSHSVHKTSRKSRINTH